MMNGALLALEEINASPNLETAENRAIPRRSVPAGCEHLRHGDLLGVKPNQTIVFQ
jgi:hypothetical protein